MNPLPPQLSIVILTLNEGDNIAPLLQSICRVIDSMGIVHEVLVVDGGSTDQTVQAALQAGAQVVYQKDPGYGGALRMGFSQASAPYVLTIDADFSHDPNLIETLWSFRDRADLIIASRYVPGGSSEEISPVRIFLSRLVNILFSKCLSLPVRDLSSGFRLYRKAALEKLEFSSNGYVSLIEILMRIYCQGWRLQEIPLHYRVRRSGSSHVHFVRFGIAYSLALVQLWWLRNSQSSTDYDLRAYNSPILPQRWWQRRRYEVIHSLLGKPTRLLDAGCGTSRIIIDHPEAVAVDVSLPKLRYLKQTHRWIAQASVDKLPFSNHSFDCVICSEVIEHIAFKPFEELRRVLRPGGRLIIGTPDYGRKRWRFIEAVYAKVCPWGYACEHITHYTAETLQEELKKSGFAIQKVRYVFGSELIIAAEKPC